MAEHDPRTASCIEAYLRIVYDDPGLRLVHIIAGVNSSSGYAYNVYGYIKTPTA
jgi:hypothetical protein